MRRFHGVLGGALAITGILSASSAWGDTAVSAGVTSDYRYRGFSLSDEQPAATLTVNYDSPTGVFLSVSGIAADTRFDGIKVLGYQAYGGYARRLSSGATWEVGFGATSMTEFYPPRYRISSFEAYTGVSYKDVSAHIYYSPNYLGEGAQTLYASADYSRRLSGNWRVLARVGVLAPISRDPGSEIRGNQADLRLGIATRVRAVEVQAAWTSISRHIEYPANHPQHSNVLTLNAAVAF